MYLLQGFFKKWIKLCRAVIWLRMEEMGNGKWTLVTRIQKHSVGVIDRCFKKKPGKQSITEQNTHLNGHSLHSYHLIKKSNLF